MSEYARVKMLERLDIQNVVLIEQLTLAGNQGLVALTGETGAGKSILLDALGLALGARADAGLVRAGTESASVTAVFDVSAKHAAQKIIADKELPVNDQIILRRVVGKDGKSKAFVNDVAVSVQTLKEISSTLIEIHGQFETQGLLDPATHIYTLDNYTGLDVTKVKALWGSVKQARDKLQDARRDVETVKRQEDYLRHVVAELEKLDPKPGEEEVLAEKRQRLLAHEKMASAFDDVEAIIEGEAGMRQHIGALQNILIKLDDKEMKETASRIKAEVDDLSWQVEKKKNVKDSAENLSKIEDRYFALREAAKKHRVTADDLPRIFEEMAQKLRLITHQEDTLFNLEKEVKAAENKYLEEAEKASVARAKAAAKLSKAVNGELPDLKLDKAKFFVECKKMDNEKDWSALGIDHVLFTVSTNPQTPAGPIHKIASGGELSRFMLALKVILAETGTIPTLIFDEVDSGIGGATADAVGERLQRLSKKYQVLVVTHSPQVAARAAHHWHVAKSDIKGAVSTAITPLASIKDRTEEIARMLSGAKITTEARAQATQLLKNQHAA